jgi:hypothetical protein
MSNVGVLLDLASSKKQETPDTIGGTLLVIGGLGTLQANTTTAAEANHGTHISPKTCTTHTSNTCTTRFISVPWTKSVRGDQVSSFVEVYSPAANASSACEMIGGYAFFPLGLEPMVSAYANQS